MIDSTFKIEVEDESQTWQDVTESVVTLSDGTSSEAQVIPTVSIGFDIDANDVFDWIDPYANKNRPRIRITEGSITTFYLLEGHNGDVSGGYPYPTISGRAYAGILDNFRPLTYTWKYDILASTIAAQVAHEDVENQSGTTINVYWGATLNPTIPGGRYEVSRMRRREIIYQLAEMCGALVRVSLDGMSIEVYDKPARTLSGSSVATYANPFSLSYQFDRVNEPANAVRVIGEAISYDSPINPSIQLSIIPSFIDADETSTASAVARVFKNTGAPVQHTAIIDESIDANSNTIIPVSGCYSVQGVWLNTGTEAEPVRGSRVEPSDFDEDTITVPDNGTDLFIVSYTQAQEVSWNLTDYKDYVIGEAQNTTGALAISTTNNIGTVQGVYRASDQRRIGTNFFEGGSYTPNTTSITLGISPGTSPQAMLVDYSIYNGSPLSATLSPSTSLCNEEGYAKTLIGSGDTAGTAVITASALGITARSNLSLVASGIGSLQLSVDPATLRATDPENPSISTETESLSLQSVIEIGQTRWFVVTTYPIVGVTSLTVAGGSTNGFNWVNSGTTYTLYINQPSGAIWVNGNTVNITYTTSVDIEVDDDTATVTATVLDSSGDPVADNTNVTFEIIGYSAGATLSAYTDLTSSGEASVTLTAGNVADFTVRAVAGGLYADVDVSVVVDPKESDRVSSTSEGATWSSEQYPHEEECEWKRRDSGDANGSIKGERQVVDCDGKSPIAFAWVTMGNITYQTDAKGWFYFVNGSEGSNAITINHGGKNLDTSFTIAPAGSTTRRSSGINSEDHFYQVCNAEEI